jgi:predicted negative regulator of RcsB-dependent stress response
MEMYDQHEQGERVRSWLKDNGAAIVTGVVIGLGAIFGYHQWESHKARKAYTAAELYEQVRVAETPVDPAAPPPAAPVDAEAARTARGQLREQFAGSGFAVLAALQDADDRLAAGDVAGARESLEWARANADEPAMETLARLRLARLELAEGKGEDALKMLDGLDGEGFAALREELRGDIHAALGDSDKARAAYEAAREAGPADPTRIEMKLSEFAIAQAPAAPPASSGAAPAPAASAPAAESATDADAGDDADGNGEGA